MIKNKMGEREMKRLVALVMTLVILVLAIGCNADNALTSGLQKAWKESTYDSWELIDSLEIGSEAFLSFRKDGTNRLVHATKKDEWEIDWSTEAALPQTSTDPDLPGTEYIILTNRSNSSYAGLQLKTAFSYRTKRNGCYEYIFQKHMNSWLLETILYLDTDGTQLESYKISDDTVIYKGWQSNNSKVYVDGRAERNLQYFSDTAFPKSLKSLKNSLSNPPTIPLGTLVAEEIRFTGGKKYSVYSGPGDGYMRGGNGKAAVSTNDWIQVFGRENGWIMIQYDITSDHMRIGWIKEIALPKGTTVKELKFGSTTAYTAAQCTITDDPLFSMSTIATIPADSEVIRLATMGGWTYVEYDDGDLCMRGFVDGNNLTVLTKTQVVNLTQTAILANPIVGTTPVTEETLSKYTIACDYDTASGQWTVQYGSSLDSYTVYVDDKTGMVSIDVSGIE